MPLQIHACKVAMLWHLSVILIAILILIVAKHLRIHGYIINVYPLPLLTLKDLLTAPGTVLMRRGGGKGGPEAPA